MRSRIERDPIETADLELAVDLSSEKQSAATVAFTQSNHDARLFSVWYSPEIMKYLLHSSVNTSRCLRYVFGDDEADNSTAFAKQLDCLIVLSNVFNRPIIFISKEPGNPTHWVTGLVSKNNLFLFNTTGLTNQNVFYATLAELQKNRQLNKVVLANTQIQFDPKGLVSCGPLCAEWAMQLSEQEVILKNILISFQLEANLEREALRYVTIDITSCLLDFLCPLTLSLSPEAYQDKLVCLRRNHLEQLQSRERIASEGIPNFNAEHYWQNCLEAPEQQLILRFDPDSAERLHLLNLKDSPLYLKLKESLELIDGEVLPLYSENPPSLAEVDEHSIYPLSNFCSSFSKIDINSILVNIIQKIFDGQGITGDEFRYLNRYTGRVFQLCHGGEIQKPYEEVAREIRRVFNTSYLLVFGICLGQNLSNHFMLAFKVVANYLELDDIKSYPISIKTNPNRFFINLEQSNSRNFLNDFSDTIVLISNSELDGFREGDGDLMDKLTHSLNDRYGVRAIRIIQNSMNVPEDKQDLFAKRELLSLSPPNQRIEDLKVLQNNFLALLNSEPFSHKKIIIYIGSRINIKSKGTKALGESGSLFDEEFIRQLKKINVKIVICCLEFRFFKRSMKQLPRAYEMLRQQLLLADKIHFLTEPDRKDFENTIAQLQSGSQLTLVREAYLLSELKVEEDAIDMSSEKEISSLEKQKQKAVFVPGIYTVAPLNESDIRRFATRLAIQGDNMLEILANREPGILHFGIIRGEKGVDEAIELGLILQERESKYKVVIAGKLMLDLGMVSKLFQNIFKLQPRDFYTALMKALKIKNPDCQLTNRKIRDFSKTEKIITQQKKHDEFNKFCSELYEQLKSEHPDKGKNIEIYFNVSEDNIRLLAMKCRYAIKLDHKGMANNASTIVSCLGFYLPVITTGGLLTNHEFLRGEFSGCYADTVIMPELSYSMNNSFNEVRPILPTVDEVVNLINQDSPENYLRRLLALKKLYEDKVFDCDNVALKLINEVFLPLSLSGNLLSCEEEIEYDTLLGS